MTAAFERVAVVGLGLLGGSVARAARERGVAGTVVGVVRRSEAAQAALDAELVDEATLDLEEGLRGADLVVLGSPIEVMGSLLARGSRALEGALVTDVGSVKGVLAETLPGLLPESCTFVGAHPMAGSHHRGLQHARADLLEGAACIVCPTEGASEAAVERVEGFWRALGTRVVRRAPDVHDREVGWVSHVPHALAFTFARALAAAPAGARDVPGTGFRDFTRIAASDPELWAEILSANRKALAAPLQAVEQGLREFTAALERGDTESLHRFIAEARDALASFAEDASSGGEIPDTQTRKEL